MSSQCYNQISGYDDPIRDMCFFRAKNAGKSGSVISPLNVVHNDPGGDPRCQPARYLDQRAGAVGWCWAGVADAGPPPRPHLVAHRMTGAVDVWPF